MIYLGGGLLRPSPTYAADGNLDVCFDGKCGLRIHGETLPHDQLAKYWEPIGGDRIHCMLCPYHCILADGERCRCQAKENSGGQLYDMVYGYVATLHLDRVEKLPIYHRYPGMLTLALGTAGCGLMPDAVIGLARTHGAGAIALAYTEPLTFFEYSLDLAKAAHKAGLKVFMGTGGFCCPEPVAELAPHVDAVAFGLKGFSDGFYNDVVGPGVKLSHIQASLEAFKAAGTHIEVANLLVLTKNYAVDDIRPLSKYVHDTLGADPPAPPHILPPLPADTAPSDRVDITRNSSRNRSSYGAEPRLYRQPAGAQWQQHLVPPLRSPGDPADRVQGAGDQHRQSRQMCFLWRPDHW